MFFETQCSLQARYCMTVNNGGGALLTSLILTMNLDCFARLQCYYLDELDSVHSVEMHLPDLRRRVQC